MCVCVAGPQIHNLVFEGALASPQFYARIRSIVKALVGLPLTATSSELPLVCPCVPACTLRCVLIFCVLCCWKLQATGILPMSQPGSPWWQMYELYFSISYIDPELEPVVKSRINSFFQLFQTTVDMYVASRRCAPPPTSLSLLRMPLISPPSRRTDPLRSRFRRFFHQMVRFHKPKCRCRCRCMPGELAARVSLPASRVRCVVLCCVLLFIQANAASSFPAHSGRLGTLSTATFTTT